MKEFAGLRAKPYSYLIDNDSGDKFKDYKNCLKATKLENKMKQLEKK